MEFVAIIAAAVAAYAFGAFWYMTLSQQWLKASGLTNEEVRGAGKQDPTPFIISGLMMIVVAGMMRHMFGMAGIEGAGSGALSGFGLGAFIAAPWIVTNYAYGMRAKMLTVIDGGYAIIGCTIMGLVLGLF